MSIRAFAPAKLNLFLHVTGKRADGYHLLDSLVAFADIGDTLEVEAADDLSLHVTGPYAASIAGENLVLKAVRALQACQASPRGARITLHKKLPVGAGMGGGSADAAAALRALSQLWGVPVPTALALQLGSDVPVCMNSAPAWMRGIGEELTPVTLAAPLWLVLANPNLPLATADIFRAFTSPPRPPVPIHTRINSADDVLRLIAPLANDLEPPAIATLPVIADMLAALAHTPGCRLARMSGSGATCFGIYDTQAQANAALTQLPPHWWVAASSIGGTHGQA